MKWWWIDRFDGRHLSVRDRIARLIFDQRSNFDTDALVGAEAGKSS